MSNEIAKQETGALPAFLQTETRTDRTNFDKTDVTIPRIKIAQDQNQEVKDGDVPRGALFLNVTGEVLADFDLKAKRGTPLLFTPIIASKEYILWRDQLDPPGGIMARARAVNENGTIRYKWDKPHTTFTTKIKGQVPVEWTTEEYIDEDGLDKFGTQIPGNPDSPPAASLHYNYLVSLPEHGDMIVAFSLSKSQVKRARDLNYQLDLGSVPMYGRKFKATIETERNPAGQEYFNVRFRPAGTLGEGDAELFAHLKDLHAQFAKSGFVVDQDGSNDAVEEGSKKNAGKF